VCWLFCFSLEVLVRILGFLLAILKSKFLSLIFKVFVDGGLYASADMYSREGDPYQVT